MPKAGRRLDYKWVVLGISSIATFAMTSDASMAAIALPELTKAFNADSSVVLWVTAAYLLTSVGLLLGLGRLSDAYGHKRFFNIGFFVFTVGMALAAVSQNIGQLILVRVVMASGAAMMLTSNISLVTGAFPDNERGRAMGVVTAVTSAGLASGPLFGGLLLDTLGWRSIFYLRIPLGIAGLALGLAYLRETSRGRVTSFDFPGALAILGGLVAIFLATNQATAWGLTSAVFLGVMSVGGLLLVAFVLIERRVAHPVFDLGMFGDRVYSSGVVSMVLYFIAGGTSYFLLPFFMIQGLGFSSSLSGLLFALFPLSMGLVSPLAGLVTDRIGSRLPAMIGVVIQAVSLVVMSLLGEHTLAAVVALVMVFNGIGSGLYEAPNISAIMGTAAKTQLGAVSASLAVSRQAGLIAGIVLGGALFAARRDHYLQTGPESAAVVAGFQEAVLWMVGVSGLAVLATALRGRGN